MPILIQFELALTNQVNEAYIQALMKEKNLEYHEATRFDFETNWKEKSIAFTNQTRCVTALYEKCFEKFKTEDCRKIGIECVEKVTDSRVLNFTGVVITQVPIQSDFFFNSSDYEKKKITLELLKQGVDIIVEEKGWDKAPFDDAYRKVIERDYVNNWVLNKPLTSPSRKYVAEVFCEHDLHSFDISIIVRNRDGSEVKRVKVKSERPDHYFYTKHLGKLKWLSQHEVALINHDGTEQWSVQVP